MSWHRDTHQSHPGFLQPHMAPCRAKTSFDSSAPQSHGDVSSPADVQECVGGGKDCQSLSWYQSFTCFIKHLLLVMGLPSQTTEWDMGPSSPIPCVIVSNTSLLELIICAWSSPYFGKGWEQTERMWLTPAVTSSPLEMLELVFPIRQTRS